MKVLVRCKKEASMEGVGEGVERKPHGGVGAQTS